MNVGSARRYLTPLLVVVGAALALSWLARVPYVFTLLGFSLWAWVGHIVTIDDDRPGGWSNPDGRAPFPWAALAVEALVFILLCSAIVVFPALRTFGG